jgi:hypothetical protein
MPKTNPGTFGPFPMPTVDAASVLAAFQASGDALARGSREMADLVTTEARTAMIDVVSLARAVVESREAAQVVRLQTDAMRKMTEAGLAAATRLAELQVATAMAAAEPLRSGFDALLRPARA